MKRLFYCCFLLLIVCQLPCLSSTNQQEIYRLRLENQAGGGIAVSHNQGQNWQQLGKVIAPARKIDEHGYAAAKWVNSGQVAASAVNAIHLKVGQINESQAIFSLLPKEFSWGVKNYKSYFSPDSSIYTNISAGTGIFGGGFAPFVGNQVKFFRSDQAGDVDENYVPQVGDTIFIYVTKPVKYPQEIVFENRVDGQVTVKYFSGQKETIAKVVQPVSGVGRFLGSRYAGPGRIRANHAGVIDVSVSPKGSIGGFQIIPAFHASELEYVLGASQWMIIGPLDYSGPSLEGTAPFFQGFIQPAYLASNLLEEDWQDRLWSRFLVEVKYDGQDRWQAMPIYEIKNYYLRRRLPDWTSTALKNISHFRILFPVI
ncbi:hypothetical protein A2291_03425 [candidate division WOR-1 bacterium RIFOXYB2_FULL_42_35]|uniref:Uncharacterized protein n=1 Tax=candidate division WOR-1 bacterium RIFOXYC2_FULL_41_25 TaxID=1802586 RepID=A0A1F4TQK4_UNCSA|nr:MAG: hypothetical protein A2247_02995 [candidate division WOR-1 bacterium RIFOXYA2_FULL_41_14]OGC25514.1 MAG: hypothetical protein A2291_03425 [candidate division WOR-1 bacterium RIFOXYB2_FULL_42_35]OGC34946.1 MAG: hypothetical protein A2462_05055 [candidate division WOR-1 bacterium RIFOXYC2_FULL_41_25]OGC42017.1 MAG: hypothetical protein A2548_00435 [candidate division WOR-1 bacterium RIFOXYD2_FULL_41_8]